MKLDAQSHRECTMICRSSLWGISTSQYVLVLVIFSVAGGLIDAGLGKGEAQWMQGASDRRPAPSSPKNIRINQKKHGFVDPACTSATQRSTQAKCIHADPLRLRLRGGRILTQRNMNTFNPDEESWSSMLDGSGRDEDDELQLEEEGDQSIFGEGQEEEEEEEEDIVLSQQSKRRLDTRKRMNVEELIKARKNSQLDVVRRVESKGGNLALLDDMYEESMRKIEHDLDKESSSETDLEKTTWGGLPVPECYMDVVNQAKVERRWRDNLMGPEEMHEYVDAAQRDMGEVPLDENGRVIPPSYAPKLGKLPLLIQEKIYPDADVMLGEIMCVVKTHMINCHNEECIERMGRDEQWWWDHLNALNYSERLEMWREKDLYDLPHGEFNGPYETKLINGEYVMDADIIEPAWRLGYNVSRCDHVIDMPACDLCQDNEMADVQIDEGRRNRMYALEGTPLVLPLHYKTMDEALLRSFSVTFFDDPRNRAWVRECMFERTDKQYRCVTMAFFLFVCVFVLMCVCTESQEVDVCVCVCVLGICM
jgi:hypothetical protein